MSRTIGKYTNAASQQAVLLARDVYRKVWASACKYDNILTDSKFVVFSNDNPFVYYVNKAFRVFINWMDEYQNGGYVGLRIAGCTKEQRTQQKIQAVIKMREQLAVLETEGL